MCRKHFSIIILLFFTINAYSHENEFRIVSLAPNLTEIIYEMNLEDHLVGVSTFSNFPDDAKMIMQVGSYLQPQIEKIIKLRPTHVLVMKEGSPVIKEQLDRAKISYLLFESKDLTDYEKTISKIAETFKMKTKGKALVDQWNLELKKFKILKLKTKKTLIQVDHNPIIVAGSETFLSNALELCSLANVYKTPGYANVSVESVMNHKPEIVLVVGQLNASNKFKDVQRFYASNPGLQNATVIEGDSDKLSRLTSRFLPEVFKVCSSLLN